MKFTVFGAGAWGTAISIHIGRTGNPITLVPRRKEHALKINNERKNADYLPDYQLSDSIQVTADIQEALKTSDVALLACPSIALKPLCQELKKHIDESNKSLALLTLCKGLDQNSLHPPVSVVKDIFPANPCGVLSGPTFAGDVAAGKPTAITLSLDDDIVLAQKIQESLSNEQLRVYTSQDVVGVEYAGCLKNVYAIGAGICDGLNLGDNAKASYLTRALHELVKIGVHLGGKPETFYGLSGFGDLVATCFGAWSRNRTFGQNISQGKKPKDILSHQKTVVEGYWATDCFYKLLHSVGFDTPILNQLHDVLYSEKQPHAAIQELMTRELKEEKI